METVPTPTPELSDPAPPEATEAADFADVEPAAPTAVCDKLGTLACASCTNTLCGLAQFYDPEAVKASLEKHIEPPAEDTPPAPKITPLEETLSAPEQQPTPPALHTAEKSTVEATPPTPKHEKTVRELLFDDSEPVVVAPKKVLPTTPAHDMPHTPSPPAQPRETIATSAPIDAAPQPGTPSAQKPTPLPQPKAATPTVSFEATGGDSAPKVEIFDTKPAPAEQPRAQEASADRPRQASPSAAIENIADETAPPIDTPIMIADTAPLDTPPVVRPHPAGTAPTIEAPLPVSAPVDTPEPTAQEQPITLAVLVAEPSPQIDTAYTTALAPEQPITDIALSYEMTPLSPMPEQIIDMPAQETTQKPIETFHTPAPQIAANPLIIEQPTDTPTHNTEEVLESYELPVDAVSAAPLDILDVAAPKIAIQTPAFQAEPTPDTFTEILDDISAAYDELPIIKPVAKAMLHQPSTGGVNIVHRPIGQGGTAGDEQVADNHPLLEVVSIGDYLAQPHQAKPKVSWLSTATQWLLGSVACQMAARLAFAR